VEADTLHLVICVIQGYRSQWHEARVKEEERRRLSLESRATNNSSKDGERLPLLTGEDM
jgi:hypothetical protein